MRISAVNSISFKGIKVNGREQRNQNNQTVPVRQAQRQVLDDWNRYFELLNSQLSAIPENNKDDIPYIEKDEFIPKDTYEKIIHAIKHANEIADIKLGIADKMLQISHESVDRIKELDEEDVKNNFYAGIRKAYGNKNEGINAVAGYKYEMQVLSEEFIDKVKREKQGEDVDIAGSVLFFGPNANGKTHITESTAQAADCNIVNLRIRKNMISQAMQKIYVIAQQSQEQFKKDRTRTIIFIDELERIINKNSPFKQEFEEFIKICSEEYHCSVFAATNHPFLTELNFDDEDVFPIKMSIEPPEGENLEKMFEFALENYETEGINYKELAQETEKRNKQTKGKISNGQIILICDDVWKSKVNTPIQQSDIIEYIQTAEPEIPEEIIKRFIADKKALIGE